MPVNLNSKGEIVKENDDYFVRVFIPIDLTVKMAANLVIEDFFDEYNELLCNTRTEEATFEVYPSAAEAHIFTPLRTAKEGKIALDYLVVAKISKTSFLDDESEVTPTEGVAAMIEYASEGYKEHNGENANGGAMSVLFDWNITERPIVLFEGKAYEWGDDGLVDAFATVKLLQKLIKEGKNAHSKKLLKERLRKVVASEIHL